MLFHEIVRIILQNNMRSSSQNVEKLKKELAEFFPLQNLKIQFHDHPNFSGVGEHYFRVIKIIISDQKFNSKLRTRICQQAGQSY